MASWASWLVLGLLSGWLIEWVIDWVYWRQRRAADLEAAQAGGGQLRADLARANAAAQHLQSELASIRAELATAHADGERVQADLQRLNDAAQRDQVDVGALRRTTEELRSETDRLRAEREAVQEASRQYQAELGALKLKLEGASSRQTVLLDANALAAPMATLSAEEPATESPLMRSVGSGGETARQRDPLIDINGIGPVYQRRLFDAGVYTFADLAALTPERVREIVRPQSWQDVDPAAWIAEAQTLAERRGSVSS